MAVLRPFRGWRYNRDRFHSNYEVFSPLFDVVPEEERKRLYGIPYNSIHLAMPQDKQRVHELLAQWKHERILIQDPLPAFYTLSQKFSLRHGEAFFTRKGFMAMVRLDKKDIILHEQTIPQSVEERVDVLARTLLNVAPTHGFYDDPHFIIENLLHPYFHNAYQRYVDYQNVINKFNIVQHKSIIEKIQQFFEGKQIILADGHHRLASSFRWLEKMEAEHPDLDEYAIARYHFMYLTNIRGSDVRILPTHRLFFAEKDLQEKELYERAKPYFQIIRIDRNVDLAEEITGTRCCFGIKHKDFKWIVILKPEYQRLEAMKLDLPPPVKALEYTQLHYYWFEKVLGIPYSEQAANPSIRYARDTAEIKNACTQGNVLGIIVNEVKIEEMLAVCRSGALMPQKSTFFYPKIVTGFVFASINEYENQSTFDISVQVPKKERTS